MKGKIGDKDVSFVLDSGAPDCMLTPSSAKALDVNLNNSKELTFKGGGGQEKRGQRGIIDSIVLGGDSVKNVPCVIGDLFNLSTLSKGQLGGMLGNSFFARFKSLTLDFDSYTLSLQN